MSEVATLPQRREITQVVDAVPILDTARFEHMQRIANVLARSSMIPETLRTTGTRDNKQDLPFEQVLSNCFLVVNQAARWGMDPFAVVSCCAVVHGRLSYEGKLVAAVLDAKLGVQLHHHFTGEPTSDAFRIYVSDQPFTPEISEALKPGISIPGLRLWDGSVGEWKTTGAGTPWTQKNFKRMLIYRGTRDWTRIYESAIMLGVYTEDELFDLAEDARARRAAPVLSLSERLAKAPGAQGFSQDHVHRETQAPRETGIEPPRTFAEAATSDVRPTLASSGAEHDPTSESDTSNSSQDPILPDAETDEPAALVSPDEVAGNQSKAPEQTLQDAEANATDAPLPSTLPGGWAIAYAAALKRAQKLDSLPKYATQFWAQYGGWPKHKDGDDGATAAAIYDVFKENFGRRELIDAALRELLP